MIKPYSDGGAQVRVNEDSFLARWTAWHSQGRARPLAAIGAQGQRPTLFIADEVLVDASDRDLVEQLVREHGATVLLSRPLPHRPSELAGSERASRQGEIAAAMPLPVRLRFTDAPRVDKAAARLEELASKGKELRGAVTVTSDHSARMAALVAHHADAGRSIGLNVVGRSEALPLTSATEGAGQAGGSNPFGWTAFVGKSRIVHAWQLVESFRQLRSATARTQWIGVLDSGFWLDGAGRPFVPAGAPGSDLGAGVLQLNLLDEAASAGGASGIKCGDDYNCPWHGNGVASAAAATVGNLAGAVGAGGTVARPALFKTDASVSQIFRCLQVCLAWGIDVLNMSIGLHSWELVFGTSAWNNAFQFAADNGLILVAAAGNDDEELPGYNVRPATRTPGVITVGALDIDAASGDFTKKASFSNYGSSLSIWAPGTGIPVAPDPDQPNGSMIAGTSVASPLVAGVAAMLRFVDHSLSSVRIRQILADTAWKGSDGVAPCLDAYAAVFAALSHRLPDQSEPNDTMAKAAQLVPAGADGSLAPGIGGFGSLSHSGDVDWWRFQSDAFSSVTITGEWYQRLSSFGMELHADDPDNRSPGELTRTHTVTGEISTLSGVLAPDTYRLRVSGSGVTAYRLQVRLTPAPLGADNFEANDTFESATNLVFERHKKSLGDSLALEWGPGTFDATLHTTPNFLTGKTAINPDFFRLKVPPPAAFRIPTVSIAQTDAPVEVMLFDASREIIQKWSNTRAVDVVPPSGSICFLRVSGLTPTRYTINVRLRVDEDAMPGPLEEEVSVIPPWWGDPMLTLRDRVQHYLVDLGNESEREGIVFQPTATPLAIELLDTLGNVVRRGRVSADGRVAIDTNVLESGAYILRVAREGSDGAMTSGKLPVIGLRLAPPISLR